MLSPRGQETQGSLAVRFPLPLRLGLQSTTGAFPLVLDACVCACMRVTSAHIRVPVCTSTVTAPVDLK